MGKVQRSKRARKHLKEALFAGLSRRIGHPPHYAGRGHWKRWHWVKPGYRIVLDDDKEGGLSGYSKLGLFD